MNFFNKDRVYKIITIIAFILIIAVSIYVILNGREYFEDRNIGQLIAQVKQFGNWMPIALFGFILVTNLVPPLPIPVPLLEIAAGSIFGFWMGFVFIWISQIISSISAFYLSKFVSKLFLKKILQNRFFVFYNKFIEKRGAFAIFVIRAAMIAPFNMGYLAGFSKISFLKFAIANALGLISESVIFTYFGSLIANKMHFPVWDIFVILVVLAVAPVLVILGARIWARK